MNFAAFIIRQSHRLKVANERDFQNSTIKFSLKSRVAGNEESFGFVETAL